MACDHTEHRSLVRGTTWSDECATLRQQGEGSFGGVSTEPSKQRSTVLTRSRGMGASALLAVAVAGSYGALAAVALTSVDLGAVVSFPGRAVEAVISVQAAPESTSQYPGRGPTGSTTGGGHTGGSLPASPGGGSAVPGGGSGTGPSGSGQTGPSGPGASGHVTGNVHPGKGNVHPGKGNVHPGKGRRRHGHTGGSPPPPPPPPGGHRHHTDHRCTAHGSSH